MPKLRHITKYWLSLVVMAAMIGSTVLVVNLIVDPLWYTAGNRISGNNFTFNERLSKTNLLMRTRDRYDCLILGSSRVTLLNPRKIKGYSCFNYSFSGGVVDEFANFARYFIKYAGQPKLVIIGVDGESLTSAPPQPNIPNFITELGEPPSLLLQYLSLDSVALSLRALQGLSPMPRYYNENFIAKVLPDQPAYSPPDRLVGTTQSRRFDLSRTELFRELRQLFPGARVLGYVPPKAAWIIAQYRADRSLNEYLEAMFKVSHVFDRFIDFSIPSLITVDTTATYDGSHFYPWVSNKIAKTLTGQAPIWGLQVDKLTFEKYRSRFLDAVDRFIDRGDIKIVYAPGKQQK